MLNAIKNLLILVVFQIPLIPVFWTWWNSEPILVAIGVVIYEGLLLVGPYIKKVWGVIEPDTINYFADFLRKWGREFRPGFPRQYKEEVINRHRFLIPKVYVPKQGLLLSYNRFLLS